MKVLDQGHLYALDLLNNATSDNAILRLAWHDNEAKVGTSCQEVLRAMIEHIKHQDQLAQCTQNQAILAHLRNALILLESQAS